MKAIILAAGMGNRLMHLTQDMPKCMLKVNGKALIEHQLDIFRSLSINDIIVVKGFLKEKIDYEGIKYYYNDDYIENNALASLFYAENELVDDSIIAYSDIVYDKSVAEKLLTSKADIALVVDIDWKKTHKPIKDMEKVSLVGASVKKIGKTVEEDDSNGEYIGLAKFTKKGIEILKKVYYQSLHKYKDETFHSSSSIDKAHISDILQEIIDLGGNIEAVVINGGWVEIDTVQDLKKAGSEITLRRITPEERRGILKRTISEKGFARVMEVHSGISAIIASNATGGKKNAFDALWISSLTESAAKGQPDIEILGPDSRLATVSEVLEVTNKPIIIDADTGGDPNAFEYFLRRAEGMGVSAVIIEDKVFPKRNSLDGESKQVLEDPRIFAAKIMRGKKSLLTNHLMIMARLESLIAGKGIDDAIERARLYLVAGADGIMIHSKEKNPNEILEFSKRYEQLSNELGFRRPLVSVPTTYNGIKESELKASGFNIVIHANHLLRASIRAMQKACDTILENERSKEAETDCCSVEEIFDLVGFSDIKNKEKNIEIFTR